jgi:hypothetical protein
MTERSTLISGFKHRSTLISFLFFGLVIFLAPFFISTAPITALTWAETPDFIEVSHTEGGAVHFKTTTGALTPSALKTTLSDIKHLGWLRSDTGSSYLLLSGRPCDQCTQEKNIYVYPLAGNTKPTQFVYPGRILDPKTRQIIFDSRAFFGKCLPNQGDIYIVFQKDKVDRRAHLQNSVFTATPSKDYLQEKLRERHLPSLATVLKRVKTKQCYEIGGRNRLMLNKPLDLPMTRDDEDNNNESEDEVKENQTAKDLPSPQE